MVGKKILRLGMTSETSRTLEKAIESRQADLALHSGPMLSYVPRGDYLSVFFLDESYYAERIDDFLTVYRSMESDLLIGCKVKGVSLLAKNVQNEITIDDDDVSLLVLLPATEANAEAKKHYYDVCRKAEILKLTVPIKQILSAAA
jgi:hypothetical protein